MARHEVIDTSPRVIAIDLPRPLRPGTFEYALNDHLELAIQFALALAEDDQLMRSGQSSHQR
jgi:hypothetical protein